MRLPGLGQGQTLCLVQGGGTLFQPVLPSQAPFPEYLPSCPAGSQGMETILLWVAFGSPSPGWGLCSLLSSGSFVICLVTAQDLADGIRILISGVGLC